MKYIIFSKTKHGNKIFSELKAEGEDVILVTESETEAKIKELETIENPQEYVVVFDSNDEESIELVQDMGFPISYEFEEDEEEEEEFEEPEPIEDTVKKIGESVCEMKKEVEAVKQPIGDLGKKADDLNKRLDSVREIINDIEKKQDFDSKVFKDLKESVNTLQDSNKLTEKDLAKISKDFSGLLDRFEIQKKDLTDKISTCSSTEDLAKSNKELATLVEDVAKIWIQIKKLFELYNSGKGGNGYVVQGTTRLSLFLEGVSLNDVFNELNFVAGSSTSITKFLNTTTRQTDLTIASTDTLQTVTNRGATTTKDITAKSFIKTGGLSSEFLKADGSSDSTAYLPTATASSTYVPYTGATGDVNLGANNLTANDVITTNSGSITRTAGLITSVAIGTRTVTINRDVNDVITGWEDAVYEWTVTRDVDGNITDWATVAK
jgi:hypothetical protein